MYKIYIYECLALRGWKSPSFSPLCIKVKNLWCCCPQSPSFSLPEPSNCFSHHLMAWSQELLAPATVNQIQWHRSRVEFCCLLMDTAAELMSVPTQVLPWKAALNEQERHRGTPEKDQGCSVQSKYNIIINKPPPPHARAQTYHFKSQCHFQGCFLASSQKVEAVTLKLQSYSMLCQHFGEQWGGHVHRSCIIFFLKRDSSLWWDRDDRGNRDIYPSINKRS